MALPSEHIRIPVTMPTFRLRSAQKDDPIIPTNTKFTGTQMRMICQLSGSTLTRPAALQACTRSTHNRHWKNSSALGDSKWNEERATLFKSTCIAPSVASAGWSESAVCGSAGAPTMDIEAVQYAKPLITVMGKPRNSCTGFRSSIVF